MAVDTPNRVIRAGGQAPRRPPRAARRMRVMQPYVLLLPCIAAIAALVLVPFAVSLWDSVHVDNSVVPDHKFVGGHNYIQVLSDPAFIHAGINTIWYLVLATVGALVVGTVMALWLHSIKRWRGLFLVCVILPWAVPGTVSGVLWSLIFNPVNGLLNSVLRSVHIISSNQIWLEGRVSGISFISVSLVWQIAPIAAIIFLAGLESIPPELYEQASVDGATPLSQFRRITLPLLRPALAIGLLEAGVLGIGIFDQVYVLAGYAPATASAVIQVYQYAFQDFNFGVGIAASVVIMAATLVLSLFYLKVVYREISYS